MESETIALSAAKQALERYARRPVVEHPQRERRNPDAIFLVNGERFVVEVKSNARSSSVARAVAQLREALRGHPNSTPLLVVPSMGEAGAEICEQENINWIDLNGNASVDTDRLHIYVRGRRDSWVDLGGEVGTNPFSRTASRVVHTLLTNPSNEWKRAQIESVAGLDKGYVSKIIAALSEQGYVEEISLQRSRLVRVVDPILLLDAWRERYKPRRPRFWGLVAARNGSESVAKVAEALSRTHADYVITGLGAAAAYTKFGSFRRIDVCVAGALPDALKVELNLGTNERGRNIAFHDDFANAAIGATEMNDVCFASPVLAYLDLAHIPERSQEAADEVRRYLVHQWK